MNPSVGQYVKIIFNNNSFAEGIVVEWSDEKSVLESPDHKSLFIIQKTQQDVLAVKIMLTNQPRRPRNIAEEEFEEIADVPRKNIRDIKKLAELREEINTLEREEISERLRSHTISNVGLPQYATPKFSSQPPPLQRSGTQGARTRVPNNTKLSDVFAGKNKTNR